MVSKLMPVKVYSDTIIDIIHGVIMWPLLSLISLVVTALLLYFLYLDNVKLCLTLPITSCFFLICTFWNDLLSCKCYYSLNFSVIVILFIFSVSFYVNNVNFSLLFSYFMCFCHFIIYFLIFILLYFYYLISDLV